MPRCRSDSERGLTSGCANGCCQAEVATMICVSIGAGVSHAHARGWRNTVGNLNHICWLKQPIAGLDLLVYARTTEGYGFIEFEISNSTISTVSRQPINACVTLRNQQMCALARRAQRAPPLVPAVVPGGPPGWRPASHGRI